MNLTKVASQAAKAASDAVGASLTEDEVEKVTAIIAKAMENAVLEASNQHTTTCADCLIHDQDLAHKIQDEIERKKIALIANLSSLR
ncbi:MAG: hypothetical protein OEQ39_14395 [Gammaproteobacteria bacterium]|nr:hypothetical protein [Gammaproteobacteria bacterium]MDH3468666.1 hypothetical protein [Gammaproteobacteria bacterium]